MTNVSKLKSRSDKGTPPTVEQTNAGKGVAPSPDETNGNLNNPPREKPIEKKKIEFSVPAHILDEFAKEAGARFGFKKGSKSDLFIAMWNEYRR